MTDIEMKIEVEAEELTEELSDEALDREGYFYALPCGGCGVGLCRLAGARQGS